MNLSKVRTFVFYCCVGVGVFVLVNIFFRSKSRNSLYTETTQIADSPVSQVEPTLRLKEFNRVEVKDGRVQWEVDGEDAKYFDKEQTATLSNPDIKIYKDDGRTVRIVANLARLSFDEQDLTRVEAEGNVVVDTPDGKKVKAKLASFDRDSEELEVEGTVEISGPGVFIEGRGMTSNFKTEVTEIEQDVLTRIDPNTRL